MCLCVYLVGLDSLCFLPLETWFNMIQPLVWKIRKVKRFIMHIHTHPDTQTRVSFVHCCWKWAHPRFSPYHTYLLKRPSMLTSSPCVWPCLILTGTHTHTRVRKHTENPVVKLIALDDLKMQTLLSLTHRYLWQRGRQGKTRKSTRQIKNNLRRREKSGVIMQMVSRLVSHSERLWRNFVWLWRTLSAHYYLWSAKNSTFHHPRPPLHREIQ